MIEKAFIELISKENADIRLDEEMKSHTSFRIGGKADCLCSVKDVDSLRNIILLCREHGVPYFILGMGSNILVSDKGNIMSVNYHNYGRQRMLKKTLNRDGYEVVCLFYKGKAHVCLVHRLVAMAFLDNPNGLPVINHLNEIKTDNRVENLCWSSIKDNVNYGTRTARMVATLGTPIVQISKDGNVIGNIDRCWIIGRI